MSLGTILMLDDRFADWTDGVYIIFTYTLEPKAVHASARRIVIHARFVV